MPGSMLWSDIADNSVSQSYPSLRKKSARRKSRPSSFNDEEDEIKKDPPLEEAMLSSDKEELTEDEFEEQETKSFDYFNIFKIPLMLFILSFVSVIFVETFGKNYVRSETANRMGMFAVDPNYGSYILNLSGK